jgi:hypothetical protein
MSEQQILHLAYSTKANAGTDPHRGLRDIYSNEETLKIIHSIWNMRVDSLDLLFSYTWGKNAGLRGASSRSVVLADLNVSYGYGPEPVKPRNRTLLLVLRKGSTHKDKHTTDRQVGVQRHHEYRQCSVFATACIVLFKLRLLDKDINFLHDNGAVRASWWDVPINQYSTYSAEGTAMRNVLADAGLIDDICKVTHHRTQAVQVAGAAGLMPHQIVTLTKHATDNLNTAYQPEAEEETLKVMSGFRKHESRFVHSEHIVFPADHEEYLDIGIQHILPEYDRYMVEYHSPHGDRTRCATKFLKHLLPYFVETVLQCGFYFIDEYPNHPLTSLLRVSTKLCYL